MCSAELIGGPLKLDPDFVFPFDLSYLNGVPASAQEPEVKETTETTET
jgi:hypothetical protein